MLVLLGPRTISFETRHEASVSALTELMKVLNYLVIGALWVPSDHGENHLSWNTSPFLNKSLFALIVLVFHGVSLRGSTLYIQGTNRKRGLSVALINLLTELAWQLLLRLISNSTSLCLVVKVSWVSQTRQNETWLVYCFFFRLMKRINPTPTR